MPSTRGRRSSPRPVLWSARALERIRGLEVAEKRAVERASATFRESGATAVDGPALSTDDGLRWMVVDEVGVLEYRSYVAGEHDQLPDGGFYVTLIVTEAGTVSLIRQHLADTAI